MALIRVAFQQHFYHSSFDGRAIISLFLQSFIQALSNQTNQEVRDAKASA
jgi:hypothetical protein